MDYGTMHHWQQPALFTSLLCPALHTLCAVFTDRPLEIAHTKTKIGINRVLIKKLPTEYNCCQAGRKSTALFGRKDKGARREVILVERDSNTAMIYWPMGISIDIVYANRQYVQSK